MIKAIGFDLDGTLYPNYKMALNSVPFFFRHPLLSLDFIHVRKDVRSFELSSDFRMTQAGILARRRGIDVQSALHKIDLYFYTEWAQIISRISPYDDLIPFLERLKTQKIRMAVMSDYPPELKLKKMGLDRYFDFAFCAEESGMLKPHAAPFRLLASRFGLSESEVLYVGNSRKNDIVGAKAAGLKTAYLGRRNCPDADIVFHSYKTLYGPLSALFV